MIPYRLHQLWISSDGSAIPPDIAANVAQWPELHPGLDHRVWSVEELEPDLGNLFGLPVLEAVRLCRFPAMQSDLLRLALVFLHGGFWSDLKNRPLERFLDALTKDELVLVEHPPMPDRPEPTDYLCNALIGAESRHPFIFDLLEEGVLGVLERREGGVVGITGLAMMMRMLRRKQKNGVAPTYKKIDFRTCWGRNMRRTRASYQSAETHWSVRQKKESLYVNGGDR